VNPKPKKGEYSHLRTGCAWYSLTLCFLYILFKKRVVMKDKLEALLAQGQDNAMLRFSLGDLCFKHKEFDQAIVHLRAAVAHDADYSAAWKMLGKALAAAGQNDEAVTAYEHGIAVAQSRGDMQAVKEMQVFLKRLKKSAGA
jgi:uncharacterized protein HemY